jgi:hypothetical protein
MATEEERLWLPTSALSRLDLRDAPPGSLVLGPPRRDFAPGSIAVRFDADERRFLLALTDFNDGRAPAGCAIDISENTEVIGLKLDAPFTIEADVTAAARRYDSDEARIGALVSGEEGAAILALFRPSMGYVHRAAISVTSWRRLDGQQLRTEFSAWRLVVSPKDRKPLVFWPFRAKPGT